MTFPEFLRYTPEHEWVMLSEDGKTATVGITDHAQDQLGDVVFIEVNTLNEHLNANTVFGSVEAVKTVSDLFLPVSGTVLEVNEALGDNPEFVNEDPYGKGWIIKLKVDNPDDVSKLLDSDTYQKSLA